MVLIWNVNPSFWTTYPASSVNDWASYFLSSVFTCRLMLECVFSLSLHWYQYAVVTATTTDTVVRTPVMHMNSALSGVANNARNREKYREIELLSILCVYVLVLSCCCCCVCEIVPLYAWQFRADTADEMMLLTESALNNSIIDNCLGFRVFHIVIMDRSTSELCSSGFIVWETKNDETHKLMLMLMLKVCWVCVTVLVYAIQAWACSVWRAIHIYML